MNATLPSEPVPASAENGDNDTASGERERPPLGELHFRFLAALHLAGELAKEVDAADACDCRDVGHCAPCLIELVGHGSELVLENFFSMAEGATPLNVIVAAKALASTWRTSPIPESAAVSPLLPVRGLNARLRKAVTLLSTIRTLAETSMDDGDDNHELAAGIIGVAGIVRESIDDLLCECGDRKAVDDDEEEAA